MSNQPILEDIKLAKNGKPFASPDAALKFMETAKLDETDWIIKVYKEGWALASVKSLIKVAEARLAKSENAEEEITYHWVEIPESSNRNDLNHAPLAINNVQLRVMRGEPVILPSNFLSLLDDASYIDWRPAGSGNTQSAMVNGGKVKRFPYIRRVDMGENGIATKEEYEGMMAHGNAVQNEEVARLKRKTA